MVLVKISLIGDSGIFVVQLLAIHPPTRVSTNVKGKFYLFWTSGIAVWVAVCVCVCAHNTKQKDSSSSLPAPRAVHSIFGE